MRTKIISIYSKINILFFFRVLIIFLFISLFFFAKFSLFIKGLHLPEYFPFLDLKGRLAHLQANKLGLDTYSVRNPFDPLGRINNKPSISLIFSFTGLNVDDAIWLGNFIISSFIFQSISLLRKTKLIFLIIGSLCIFNPNVIFAIERCNDDIIIFLFCFLIPYIISKNHFFNSISIFIVWFLSAIKYYPLSLYLLFITKNFTKSKIYISFIIFINTIWLTFSFKEILILKKRWPNSNSNFYSFSLKDLFEFGESSHHLLIFIFLTSVIIGYLYLKSEKKLIFKILLETSDVDKRYFIIGITMLIFCYVAYFNWSYRLIHSIFLLPVVLNLLSETNLKSLRFKYIKFLYIIIISLIISNWSSLFSNYISLNLKIIFNFIFFTTSSVFGIFIFEELNLNVRTNLLNNKSN